MNPGGTLLVDISGYFLDGPYIPTPHGIWTWAVPGVTDAFQNTQIEGARAFGGWPGLSVALLGTVASWDGRFRRSADTTPRRTAQSCRPARTSSRSPAAAPRTSSTATGRSRSGGPTHTASSGTGPHKRAGVCQVDDKRSQRDGQQDGYIGRRDDRGRRQHRICRQGRRHHLDVGSQQHRPARRRHTY